MNTRMTINMGDETKKVDFLGFGTAPSGDITCTFRYAGEDVRCTVPNPDAAKRKGGKKAGNDKADPGNPNEYGTVVPGELLVHLPQRLPLPLPLLSTPPPTLTPSLGLILT